MRSACETNVAGDEETRRSSGVIINGDFEPKILLSLELSEFNEIEKKIYSSI